MHCCTTSCNPVIIGNFVLFFRRGLSLAYHDSVRQIGGHTTLIPAASVPKALAVAVRIAELKPPRHFKTVEAVSPRQMKPERNEMVTRSVTKAVLTTNSSSSRAATHRSSLEPEPPTANLAEGATPPGRGHDPYFVQFHHTPQGGPSPMQINARAIPFETKELRRSVARLHHPDPSEIPHSSIADHLLLHHPVPSQIEHCSITKISHQSI